MSSSIAFLRRVRFLAPLFLSGILSAQQPATSTPPAPRTATPAQSHSDSKPDTSKYSQEPIVIEEMSIKVRWESDGRGAIDETIRERIQAESAVTSEGVLPFQYDSDNQTLDIK